MEGGRSRTRVEVFSSDLLTDTPARLASLQDEEPRPLYEGTGFPQEVQGKPSENYGESVHGASYLLSVAYGSRGLVEPVLAAGLQSKM